jgi:hypothetical protein
MKIGDGKRNKSFVKARFFLKGGNDNYLVITTSCLKDLYRLYHSSRRKKENRCFCMSFRNQYSRCSGGGKCSTGNGFIS